MKKILTGAVMLVLMAGSVWAAAGNADSADTTEALRLCQFQTAMAGSWLGPHDDWGAKEAKESRKYILDLGRKDAQGDYVSYECVIKYINDCPGTQSTRMLQSAMTLEQNRLILEASRKKAGVQ